MPTKLLFQCKSLLIFFYNQCFVTFFENCCCSRAYFKHFLTLAILLVAFFICPFAFSAERTIAWDSNTETDLAGYKIYYGTSSRNYSHTEDVGNVTEYTIVGLQEGVTYYFAAKAYNYTGTESTFSEELVYTLSNTNGNSSPTTPSVPSGPTSGSTETLYNFTTSSDDPDGDSLEYQYDWGDGDLSSWGSSSQTHTWSSPGNFCVRSMAKDSHDATSGWSNCHDITITAQSQTKHTITASAGINGRISPSGNLIVNNGADQSFTFIPYYNYHVLDVLVDGVTVGAVTSYRFTNITQNHTISATFSLSNQQPIANAGPNQTVSEGEVVTLSAKNSSDHEGNIVFYFWEQITGPSVQMSNRQRVETTFVAPDVGSEGATLRFRLAVMDKMGRQGTDYCDVFVTQESVEDEDSDGVPDSADAFPSDPNEWLDTDGDGLGNNADGDDDEDGLPDMWELLYGLDPLTNDAQEDPDGDGIVNIDEYANETDPIVFENNLAPNQPEIVSPTNESMVELRPVLEASAFFDDDVDDYHTGSQWQVFVEENDLCILSINTGISLTSLNVPRLILSENTTYYWKVRYFDSAGIPSKWSEPAYFMTDAYFADADNDGVPDHQAVEGTQDLDRDGIDDASQEDIKVIKAEVGTANIGISVKESDTVLDLISVEAEDPHELEPDPAGEVPTPEDLPFGLINYKILVEQLGDEAVVIIYFSEAAPEGSKLYKYDPIEGAWYDYSAYSEFSEDRKSVEVLVKDGGFGDLDGVENGIIIDPVGIIGADSAIDPVGIKDVNPAGNDAVTTSSSGGSGGSGGCFISTTAPKMQANQSINLLRWTPKVGIVTVFLILFVIYRRRVSVFNF